MISPQSVSVVVQGPVDPTMTPPVLSSIRQHFPDAELVLSTWRDADVTRLDYDVLQLNDDPGPIPNLVEVGRNPNANRMLVSTRNGLNAATRPYAIKTRTDIVFRNANVLTWQDRYPERSVRACLFSERIVVSTFSSVNPHRGIEDRVFHLSDIFQMGLRKDLIELWSAPLVDADWKAKSMTESAQEDHLNIAKYSNEQYLWLSFYRRHRTVTMKHPWDANVRQLRRFEQFAANNTVIVDAKRLGIHHLKHKLRPMGMINTYTHGEWRRLYRKYANPKHVCWIDFETAWRDVLMSVHEMSGKRLIPIINASTRLGKHCLRPLFGDAK